MNTIYNSKLGKTGGKIVENSKNNFKNVENTYLDIYLVIKKNGNKGTPGVFIKHSGENEVYKLSIEVIKVSFGEKNQSKIKFNQPNTGEEINYTIFIDKKDYLPKKKL